MMTFGSELRIAFYLVVFSLLVLLLVLNIIKPNFITCGFTITSNIPIVVRFCHFILIVIVKPPRLCLRQFSVFC